MDISTLSQDSNFWLVISFLVFVVVAYKMGARSVTKGLDDKIYAIQKELEVAENKRIEAQELLAQYNRKSQDAETRSKLMIEKTEEQIKIMKKDADQELKDLIAKRQEWLQNRLLKMQDNARDSLITQITNEAISLAYEKVSNDMSQADHDLLVEQALSELKKHSIH